MSKRLRSALDASFLRESIRQIIDATSGPELVGASRLARALNSHVTEGFDDLLVHHGPDLAARRHRRTTAGRLDRQTGRASGGGEA